MPSSTRVTGNGQATGLDLLDQLTPGRAPRRRNWPRVGAAVALAVFCGALFVLLYASAGARHPYLAVALPVAAGNTITAADLTTARVQSDAALSPIPASEAEAVVGRHAAVALVPGTLLTPADLAAGPVLGADEASVGLDLKPGEVPGDLVPGANVVVIDTSSSGQTSSPVPDVLVSQAPVLSVVQPTANSADGDTQVTLAVPADLAADVATAASGGDVAIAGLGSGAGSS
ncbi:MAG TPA: SAF domain-containing protein [Acidimicrobiales bacterium]|nr:SAF domain-containing protein [Acidimicrobiales bacterium]